MLPAGIQAIHYDPHSCHTKSNFFHLTDWELLSKSIHIEWTGSR